MIPVLAFPVTVARHRVPPAPPPIPLSFHSLRSFPEFLLPSFQSLPHSFVFHIQSSSPPFYRFRTLAQKTGGTPPNWSSQSQPSALFTGPVSLVAGHFFPPLTPFPASLTQKQGVYMLWSYHAPKTKPLLQAAFLHWPLVAGHRSLVAFSTPPFTRSAFFRAAGLSPLASLIDSRLRIGAWPGETSENA